MALAAVVGLAGVAGLVAIARRPANPSLPSFQRLTFRRGFVSGARFGPPCLQHGFSPSHPRTTLPWRLEAG